MAIELVGNKVLEKNEIPISRKVDVLVVGGGIAGVAAAISAARSGKKTLLVERNSCVGGTATAGMMGQIGGPTEYAHGVGKEIIDHLIGMGQAKTGPYTLFNPESLKNLLLTMLAKEKVELLLYSWFSKAVVEKGQVKGIILENKSGRQGVLGGVTIDTTGDGDVAADAGVPFLKGRESDGRMRPMTLIFELGNLDAEKVVKFALDNPQQFSSDANYHVVQPERRFVRLTGFFHVIEEAREKGELDPNIYYMRFEDVDYERRTTIVNTVRVYDVDGTRAEDLTIAEQKSREQIGQLVKFIRRYVPGCENAYLSNVASNLGVRETRHVQGDYVLTEDDVLDEKIFADNITKEYQRNVPRTEVHSPDPGEGSRDDKRERELPWEMVMYSIPYRCLVPQKIEQLLIAGRCISATHQADGWTRSIPSCISMGTAAGVAAGIALTDRVPPRQIDVASLQKELLRRGVRVK